MLAQSVKRFAAKDNDVAAAIFDTIRRRLAWCRRDVLRELLDLAVEIAREGREGRRKAGKAQEVGNAHDYAPFAVVFATSEIRIILHPSHANCDGVSR